MYFYYSKPYGSSCITIDSLSAVNLKFDFIVIVYFFSFSFNFPLDIRLVIIAYRYTLHPFSSSLFSTFLEAFV